MEDKEKLKAEIRRWEETTLSKSVSRFPERRELFESTSHIELKRLYTPLDEGEGGYGERLGFPGEYPFTRGVQPTMYRGRFWTMRQYSGFATAEETNRRYKYLLDHGQTGLSVAFDLPTQIGYDSDHPMAAGEVGKVGVAIDSLADMETVFEGIPLDKVSTSMTINATAVILLAMYLAVAEKQRIKSDGIRGTIQNDILKEYVARGAWIFPLEPSVRLIGDTIEYCMENIPRFNPISISGAHFRGAGANAIQELAFTLADAITYIEKAQERGIAVDDIAPRLSYSLGCFMDLFEEVAKYRAARRLFAKIMRERFSAHDPRSYLFRIFSGSCGSTLVTQQPINNIVRVTMHALMGILGGHQAIHTACWDEGYAIPTEDSVRIALRTQQILAHESGLTHTIDPLAGSYYVESLTNEIEERTAAYLKRIDDMGGMIKAIENGFAFKEIQESSIEMQKKIDSGEKVIVGLNRFIDEEDEQEEHDIFEMEETVEEVQKAKLSKVKEMRDDPSPFFYDLKIKGSIAKGMKTS